MARLKLDKAVLNDNLKKLKTAKDFDKKLAKALEIIRPKNQTGLVVDELKVDELLYDGFVPDADKIKMSVVRAAEADKLADLQLDFDDDRLKLLLPLYKARNFPKILSQEEQESWEEYRTKKLLDGGDKSLAANYFKRLSELGANAGLSEPAKYLLEELQLYGQSVLPFS